MAAATVPVVTVSATGAGGSGERTAAADASAAGTGCTPPTAGSSPSAPPATRARSATRATTSPGWPPPRRATATGWPTTTATCSPPVTPGSSAAGPPATDDIAAFAARPQGDGYWMATRTGAVENYGAAPAFPGATVKLSHRIATLASTASGAGAWMAGIDGGVITFGDAAFFGSMGGKRLNQPIVGLAPTVSGRGYWLVASDGGIFSFGDARFFGSMGGTPLVAPVVGMAATPTGAGYWMVAVRRRDLRLRRRQVLRLDGRHQRSTPRCGASWPGRGAPTRSSNRPTPPRPARPARPAPPARPARRSRPARARHPGGDPGRRRRHRLLQAATPTRPPPAARRHPPRPVHRGVDRRRQRLQQRHGRPSSTTATGRRGAATRTAPGRRPATTTTAPPTPPGTTATSAPVAGTAGEGLVQLRHRRLARDRPQQQLQRGRRLPGRQRPGAVAPGRPRRQPGPLHRGHLAPPPVQLREAATATTPRSARCGTPSTPAGADLVLNGHEHVYERFAPQRPNQARDDAFGIRQFTVGTGGASAYTFAGTAQPNSQVRNVRRQRRPEADAAGRELRLELPPRRRPDVLPTPGSGACHDRPVGADPVREMRRSRARTME